MFPKIIHTPRLYLRPLHSEDAEHLKTAISHSLSTLSLWMDWAVDPFLLANAFYRIESHNVQRVLPQGSQAYGIFLKETHQLIGEISVHHRNIEQGYGQLGYWMSQLYQGQGFMREAVIAITFYLFQQQDFLKLDVYCEKGNDRSIQIAQSLGFQFEQVLQQFTMNLTTKNTNDVFVFSRINVENLPQISWSFL